MRDILNIFIMVGVILLLFGCATIQERQALSDWREEDRQRHSRDAGGVRLPEISETSSLDDYVLYALLNNPGLEAAFEKWRAALARVTPCPDAP